MRARDVGLMLGLVGSLGACTAPPPGWDINMPGLTISVGMDPDMWALNTAQWAFADASRTRGLPVEGARAAAALEYLTVQINTAPRWGSVDPLAAPELVRARLALRNVLGIRADAPPGLVIDSLLHCARALSAGDPHAAGLALSNPAFSLPPEQTLAILANLPFLREANIATARVGTAPFGGGGPGRVRF